MASTSSSVNTYQSKICSVRCRDKSWEGRNEQANKDEEQEDWMQKRRDLIIFRLSKFEPAVCEQVDQGHGFRVRTSTYVVDWQGRASGKRTRSPVAKFKTNQKDRQGA